MGVVNVFARLFPVCFIASSLFGLVVSASVIAQAQTGSTINATICDSQGPEIILNTPVSDSVTNLPSIPIQGTAVRTSQIDIYRNGQYDQSVSVGESSPQISTTIALDQGTNTIRLEAFYSCNQTTATLTRIITYRPDATGGNASNTDTEIIKPGLTVPRSVSNPAKQNPDQSRFGDIIDNIKENFGFKKGTDISFVRPVRSWLLFLVSVVAAFMIFAPAYFIGMLRKLFKIKLSHKHKATRITIRIIGVILVVLFTLLLVQ